MGQKQYPIHPLPKLCKNETEAGYTANSKNRADFSRDELAQLKAYTANYLPPVFVSTGRWVPAAFVPTRNFPLVRFQSLIDDCANDNPSIAVTINKIVNNKIRRINSSSCDLSSPSRRIAFYP